MHLIRRKLRRAREEAGFAIVSTMGLLLVGTLFAVAALGAVTVDIPLARTVQDRQSAYAAAEAGIQEYLFQLERRNDYWASCTDVAEPHAVNQRWDGTGSDPRRWRNVPQSSAQYAIELIPANGYTECSRDAPEASMIDAATTTFKIRSTGRYRGTKRSIVATFRRPTFLDFLYFTDYETADPVAYSSEDMRSYASQFCVRYRREGRSSPCTEIQFAPRDVVAGPFHTNDEILACQAPTFGRTLADPVEVGGGAMRADGTPDPANRGWRASCSGTQPNFQGAYRPGSSTLTLPASTADLSTIAETDYSFRGQTTIRLDGDFLEVTNAAVGTRRLPLPPNGLIYVDNDVCTASYQLNDPYNSQPGCADVYVSGRYSRSLTIASRKDVIVNGDVTREGDVMLGLIAEQFVRVYHPVSRGDESCTNQAGSMQNVRIDAAILSLLHSFIVDNYNCGQSLGTLTVNGVIAQKFRGAVGTGGSTIATGYTKAYGYDDRLRFRSPPHFLDPVQSAWRVGRQHEQVPAR